MGKDATTLARDIEAALGKFIREPVVSVIVTSFVGPQRTDPGRRRSGETADDPVQTEDDAA